MTETFLDHLAATCNVRASAAAIGVGAISVYNKRRGNPDFLVQWEEALVCGYQMLETRLVGHALAGGTPDQMLSGDPDEPALCADFALRLIAMRNAERAGRGHRGGRALTRATKAETDAALVKKLAAIESRLKVAE